MNLESNNKNTYTNRDLNLLRTFASQAAVAIENARLYQNLQDKLELDRELLLARRFQKALLPRHSPRIPNYAFGAINIPSKQIGGDLYDYIIFADGRIGLAIGDVSGKGTPAAILMATLYASYRGILRTAAPLEPIPGSSFTTATTSSA